MKAVITQEKLGPIQIESGVLTVDFEKIAEAAVVLRRIARELEASEPHTTLIAQATDEQLAEAVDHVKEEGDTH